MIMTFDFAFMAQRDKALRTEIEQAILSKADSIVYTDIHKLSFSVSRQVVTVEPLSGSSLFRHKIITKAIKYSAIIKMLNNNWDNIGNDEISDI